MSAVLAAFIRVVDAIMRVVRAAIAVLLVVSVLLNFANVIGRKFLSAPIIGAEEVMNFLMVSVVFLGAGVVEIRRRSKTKVWLGGMTPLPLPWLP